MQAEILREITPDRPVTTNLRALRHRFDHFDLAGVLDFVSIESTAAIKSRPAEIACEIDMLRSLKKDGIKTPDGDVGFWVMEQKAGNVNWQEVNALVRPGVLRMFTYQLVSRGATAVLFFRWRQPRFGSEKFHGAVLPHNLEGSRRVFNEVAQIGEELKILAPALKGTKVTAEACILYSHDNDWTLAAAEPAEQIFQPARTHPAHLHRAARPQHPRGFRAARTRICRDTKSSSRRRCICFPPATPTA